jgi:DNA-binding winged helix-turn-helix (wHTH) protein
MRGRVGLAAAGCYPVMRMIFRFGLFELETESAQLLKSGRIVRIQQQPFKLLCLLITQAGKVVSRDDIRSALWPAETFVDYDQGVNFAMKQVREALGDDAEHAVYIQTVPKRGYRFIAPVDAGAGGAAEAVPSNPSGTDLNLQKVLWSNIAELRLAEVERARRRQSARVAMLWGGIALAVAAIAALLLR